MKASKLRELNLLDLESKLKETLESYQNLKFQQALQQLEDGTLISKSRKEIAQIKTVINEHVSGIRKIEGSK
ncbi:50S ribosomal protein L29 [Candidatus Marinimicrobia bacterium]|jgi:ribosomal protein L29|nr:50S ribosomal protein L29 [Candidatus Neomarinimicrobiota bacterium]|tara:strand:+ start:360 stop:575 length:216 start_codon:yes stop_codon:yes gene_type:complete